MDPATFQLFRAIAYREAGMSLGDGKEALVSARVARRMRALNLPDERSYADFLLRDRSGSELVQFLDAISTNFTSFFREPPHFDLLRGEVSERLSAGQRRFRFWSAACSSGEEPYSMAMCIDDLAGSAEAEWKVLATDISTSVLRRAEEGTYRFEEVQSVPRHLRSRYFSHRFGTTEAETHYTVVAELKQRIAFRRLNLAVFPLPMGGPLDVVFCRNVMIYFDRPMRQSLVAEVERLLAPGGVLVISQTETLNGVDGGLRMERPSVYRKPWRRP